MRSETERAFPSSSFTKDNPPLRKPVRSAKRRAIHALPAVWRHQLAIGSNLSVGAGKAGKLLVAADHSGVKRFLGGLAASPDLFGFLVNDGADLKEVAQANAA